LGLANFVFVEITMEKHDDKVLDRFGAAVARMPEVIEADLVTGEYDYLIKVAVRDMPTTSDFCGNGSIGLKGCATRARLSR
jgi:DNA-binding Lrp family transcriptional regulator